MRNFFFFYHTHSPDTAQVISRKKRRGVSARFNMHALDRGAIGEEGVLLKPSYVIVLLLTVAALLHSADNREKKTRQDQQLPVGAA